MLAVICDDLTEDRDILLDFCARYAKNNHLPIAALSFENAGALLQSQEARGADVIFMDIYMEGALGVDAARRCPYPAGEGLSWSTGLYYYQPGALCGRLRRGSLPLLNQTNKLGSFL